MIEESALSEAIDEVTGSMPKMVMQRIVDQVLVLISGADGAVVELAHDSWLTYVCAAGRLADHVGTILPAQGSLSGLAVQTGETQHCLDAATDERVARRACLRIGAISMVCVPLRRGVVPIGVLKVSSARAGAFDRDDVAVLTRLAKFITATITAASEIAEITNELIAGDVSFRAAPETTRQGGDRCPPATSADQVSSFVANVLRPGIVEDLAIRQQIEEIIAQQSIEMVAQPIVDLNSGDVVAVEALARFPAAPSQPPDAWFAQAHRLGLGVQLEMVAVRHAVKMLDQLPPGVRLGINASPQAIGAAELGRVLHVAGARRIIVELTEHLKVDDYPRLRLALTGLRNQGVRLAVDDTGAGFASLAHIVKLAPEIIKLDRQFTRGIDLDPVRRSVAGAFVTLAQETGATVIAEGIETAQELDTVRGLGIGYGQGYFIAWPAVIASLAWRFPHLATDPQAARHPSSTPSGSLQPPLRART